MKNNVFKSLISRIALPFLVEMLLIFLLLGVIAGILSRELYKESNLSFASSNRDTISSLINSRISLYQDSLTRVAGAISVEGAWGGEIGREEMDVLIGGAVGKPYTLLFSDIRGREQGIQYLSDGSFRNFEEDVTPDRGSVWFNQAVQYGETVWSLSPGGLNSGDDGPGLTVSTVVMSSDGNLLGVAALYSPISSLMPFLDSVGSEARMSILLSDESERVLVEKIRGVEDRYRGEISGAINSFIRLGDIDQGDESLQRFRISPGEYYGSSLLIDLPGDELLRVSLLIPGRKFHRSGSGFLLLLGLLVIAGGFILVITLSSFSRWIIQPIHQLSSAARSFASGEWDVELPLKRNDELGDLSRSLHLMAGQLRSMFLEMELQVQQRTAALMVNKEKLERSLEELSSTQGQLIESEKLAALGGLVGAMAHDVNGPIGLGITAVSSQLSELDELEGALNDGRLTLSYFRDHLSSSREALTIVYSNLKRSSELLTSFKKLAADQHVDDDEEFLFTDLLENMRISLSPVFRRSPVELVFAGEVGLKLRTSRGLLWQIASNLVMNALKHGYRDAESGSVELDYGTEGSDLVFSVRDRGQGIPEEIRDRVFDAFFTTARDIGGTGLGLQIVRTLVVDRFGGTIDLESEVGRGSLFTVRLPGVVVTSAER